MKTRLIDGACVRRGSANVYADLALVDADKLHIKTRRVIKIRKSTAALGLTQRPAAVHKGQTRPKVPDLLRRDFSNLPERQLIDRRRRRAFGVGVGLRLQRGRSRTATHGLRPWAGGTKRFGSELPLPSAE